MDEEELITLSQQGDQDSFRALMERYRPTLVKTSYLTTRDSEAAQDVVQETLVRVWRGLPSYKPRGSFRAWLIKILMNQARRQYRRKLTPTVPLAAAAEMPSNSESPDDAAQRQEQHEQVREALELLTNDHREVVILRYFSELTVPEIAQALSCREGTVKSRLSRAQSHLKQVLSEDSPEPGRTREVQS